ncbi:hypothetical protein BDK51DRAFT_47070 [Blyttiomyces helicus]|uniref:AB hydrolase-1 domain-containing protein n=1 Tax=Blyttiomyces helicus TaxID=388810 RepID=A0A4P9W1D9_9FUNG|nr:hypothetical protein BDK51DRAFT_47070 [Blyttiomyces helicus]|eukprot:RKO85924.1 hypothetical protein BDK51DRAFT_47070 [Blyttiomyces helicus]
MTFDFADRVGAIGVPTLVIAAAEDRVDAADVLKAEVLGRIEGAQWVVNAGSGHLVPLEAPVAVAGHLSDSTVQLFPSIGFLIADRRLLVPGSTSTSSSSGVSPMCRPRTIGYRDW